ncbi:hypothetical protein EK21DRAFT_114938 [Setomelanomma holmii]|uniref:3-hydroxyacyl-CoA dehydrogenase n=1 Tax=Setomelanomma holmii TaxID=210430 RepID=A0A9P4H4X8_9PLEO|nr:hypothetical protein EK21DRAFT_114938 [Setomelanomma holmii]
MSWKQPRDYASRPVAVLGAGVLGRRIACTWVAAGYTVHIHDPSSEQRSQCLQFSADNMAAFQNLITCTKKGEVKVFEEIEPAVKEAWLIIEAIPEKLDLKVSTFATLVKCAPQDALLATNSSSYKSSEIVISLSESGKRRAFNMHYYMPPANMVVELMTDQFTDPEIFTFLSSRLRETGALPYVARKESTGFIFNRLWAAVKRETLMILSEGVSDAKQIDELWSEMFIKGKAKPCEAMDQVGLDTVAFIESHYIAERGLPSTHTTDFLKKEYVDQGKLGDKSKLGGLYPPEYHAAMAAKSTDNIPSTMIALDTGLSLLEPSLSSGELLILGPKDTKPKVLFSSLAIPDGVAIDKSTSRIFWTCMGVPDKPDGTLSSSALDGTDLRTLIAPGTINTPKQLCLDRAAQKIYFSDREGCAVYRCNYNGTDLEMLVKTGSPSAGNELDHCVGIAVSPALGKFYWTQKGNSKGGQGRIFCADIAGASSAPNSREDVTCILDKLPEPIDLEINSTSTSHALYWTDRGELPFGNSLNRVALDDGGIPVLEKEDASPAQFLVAKHFNEAIGLALDNERGKAYVSDLGGRIYECDLESGEREVVYEDVERSFTGIAML